MTAAVSVAALPAVAALPVASTAFATTSPIEPDPIFAAIAEFRRLFREWLRLSTVLDEAEHEKGHPPPRLIAWRNYTAIGGNEIEITRNNFLADRIAKPATIEREYLDAKARERAANAACRQWYKKNGLAELKAESDRAQKAESRADWALTKIRPTTIAGVASLVAHVRDDMKAGDRPWQLRALANAVEALHNMGERQIAREAVRS
jgi:hypothetical protein